MVCYAISNALKSNLITDMMQLNHISPYFSIVIPCWGAEEYFDEATSSVLKQSFCDLELILVDDKSPGNIPTMCDELAQKDVRVKVIHNSENLNISATQNVGLLAAEGEYILFLDNDDYLEPDILQVAHDHIESADRDEKPDIVQCKYNLLLNGTVKPRKYKLSDKYAVDEPSHWLTAVLGWRMSSKLPTACAGKFIRRQMLLENQIFFNSRYDSFQDFDFTMRAYFNAKRVSVLDRISFVHRSSRSGSVATSLSLQSSINRLNMWVDWIEYTASLSDVPFRTKLAFMFHLGSQINNTKRRARESLSEQELKLFQKVTRRGPLINTLSVLGAIKSKLYAVMRKVTRGFRKS